MTTNKELNSSLIYQGKDGAIELKLQNEDQTIIANLNQIAAIFSVGKSAISKHF